MTNTAESKDTEYHTVDTPSNLADLEHAKAGYEDDLMKFKTRCEQHVRAGVTLMNKTKTVNATASILKDKPASAPAPDSKHVVVCYAACVSGEAATNPQTRKPPFRAHYNECMQAMLESRPTQQEIHQNDIYIMTDVGRHGHPARLQQRFSDFSCLSMHWSGRVKAPNMCWIVSTTKAEFDVVCIDSTPRFKHSVKP